MPKLGSCRHLKFATYPLLNNLHQNKKNIKPCKLKLLTIFFDRIFEHETNLSIKWTTNSFDKCQIYLLFYQFCDFALSCTRTSSEKRNFKTVWQTYIYNII